MEIVINIISEKRIEIDIAVKPVYSAVIVGEYTVLAALDIGVFHCDCIGIHILAEIDLLRGVVADDGVDDIQIAVVGAIHTPGEGGGIPEYGVIYKRNTGIGADIKSSCIR
jgi:hypothetical protein